MNKIKRGTGTALLPFITHQNHQKTLAKVSSMTDSGLKNNKQDVVRESKKQ